MPGKGTPGGIEKNFLQMSRLGSLLAMFPENPRNWPVRSLMEEGDDCVEQPAAGPAGTCP